MAPLFILLSAFLALWLVDRYILSGKFDTGFIGRVAMASMLVATGIAHFTGTDQMIAMMPDAMPAKRELVYFTGVCELLAVPGLLLRKTSRLTSVVLIVFFVLILPANIIGSIKGVNFGGMEHGTLYLLFRIPLQIFFIWWCYYFGLRKAAMDDVSNRDVKTDRDVKAD